MPDLEVNNTEVDVFLWQGSSIAGCSSYLSVRVRLALQPTPELTAAFNDLIEASKTLDKLASISSTQIS